MDDDQLAAQLLDLGRSDTRAQASYEGTEKVWDEAGPSIVVLRCRSPLSEALQWPALSPFFIPPKALHCQPLSCLQALRHLCKCACGNVNLLLHCLQVVFWPPRPDVVGFNLLNSDEDTDGHWGMNWPGTQRARTWLSLVPSFFGSCARMRTMLAHLLARANVHYPHAITRLFVRWKVRYWTSTISRSQALLLVRSYFQLVALQEGLLAYILLYS